MQAFRVVCRTFGVRPLSSCILHLYASHSAELVGWHSLVGRIGSVLFKAFTASYKNFKEKLFKVFVEPAGTCYFFDEVSQSRFPLFWTRKPTEIKDWPRPVNPSESEREVFALFDNLPKLPTWPLMSLYTVTDRAKVFEGMFYVLRLWSFVAFSSLTCFLVSEIAKREIPQAISMLSSFRNKLNEKRTVIGGGAPATDTAQAGCSKSSKKRAREERDIACTVWALGQMPTCPSGRTVTRVGLPLTDDLNRSIPTVVVVPVVAVEESSLALLGGDRCFTGR